MTSRDKVKYLLKENKEFRDYFDKNVSARSVIGPMKELNDARRHIQIIDDEIPEESIKEGAELFQRIFSSMDRQAMMEVFEYATRRDVNLRYALKMCDQPNVFAGLINNVASMVTVEDLIDQWAKEKVFFTFTSEMAETLAIESDEELEIPVETFRHMPFQTYFIDSSYIGDKYNLIGVIVRQDIEKDELEICAIDNNAGYPLPTSITLPIKECVRVADLYDKFQKEIEYGQQQMKKMLEDDNKNSAPVDMAKERHLYLKSVCVKAIPYILYLTCENPDMTQAGEQAEKVKKSGSKKQNVQTLGSGAQKYIVGREFSIHYRNYINNQKAKVSGSTASGSESIYKMPPHRRRGHYHHHWVGSDVNPEKKGPKRLVLYWQEPTFIHEELKELVEPTVYQIASSNKAKK